jgi:hypothetical protein
MAEVLNKLPDGLRAKVFAYISHPIADLIRDDMHDYDFLLDPDRYVAGYEVDDTPGYTPVYKILYFEKMRNEREAVDIDRRYDEHRRQQARNSDAFLRILESPSQRRRLARNERQMWYLANGLSDNPDRVEEYVEMMRTHFRDLI